MEVEKTNHSTSSSASRAGDSKGPIPSPLRIFAIFFITFVVGEFLWNGVFGGEGEQHTRLPHTRGAGASLASGHYPAAPSFTPGTSMPLPPFWDPYLSPILRKLLLFGFWPTSVLDVGANIGEWTRAAHTMYGTERTQYHMIEGSTQHIESLDALGVPYVIAVVGAKVQNVTFYTNPYTHTGNSLHKEQTKFFDQVIETTVTMRTIDELMAGKAPVQLLKLDIQGAEVEALRGATRTLQTVDVIVMEANVLPYNSGSPLLSDTISFMHSIGFEAVEIIEQRRMGNPVQLNDPALGAPEGHQHPATRTLIQLDFLFIRRATALFCAFGEEQVGVGHDAGAGSAHCGQRA